MAFISIITLGIYYLFWQYQVFRDLKQHTGEGVGGVIGLVIGIVIGIVNWFLLPSEIGNMYAKAGMEKPVRGVTGFWNLIPIVGFFIWVWKVQTAMNERWESAGADVAPRVLQRPDDGGVALAAAAAQRRGTEAAAAPAQLVDERDARCACPTCRSGDRARSRRRSRSRCRR